MANGKTERKNEMKNIIGFVDSSEEQAAESREVVSGAAEEREPVRCIAKVSFGDSGSEWDYYNDEFYLEPGDRVFVSGKRYGEIGLVTSVSTHFKVNKSKYKKVIAKPDFSMKGTFFSLNDKMVSFDSGFSADQFAAIVIPPENPEDPSDPEDIICGDGWSVDLEDFESSDDVDGDVLQRAFNYCCEGKVKYLSLSGCKGVAFIKGKNWYRVDFDFDGETVVNMYCDCPFQADCLCKHELAVLITLRMLLGRPELAGKSDFITFDKALFWKLAPGAAGEIVMK